MSALFAATYPGRVTALILFGAFSSGTRWKESLAESGWLSVSRIMEIGDHWGEGRSLEIVAPSIVNEDRIRRFAAFERAAARPAEVLARWETILQLDATPVLGTLHVPTLVLHRDGDRMVPAAVARAMAEAIPGAR